MQSTLTLEQQLKIQQMQNAIASADEQKLRQFLGLLYVQNLHLHSLVCSLFKESLSLEE